MILGLASKKLAGKTTAANFFVENYNAEVFRFSDVLVGILNVLEKDITRTNLVNLGHGLRNIYNDDFLAEVLVKRIKKSKSKLIIIDGLRYLAEYEMLKRLNNFKLLYIEANIDIRYQRIQNRTEKKDESTMSFEDFSLKENDPTEKELLDLKSIADAIIQNESDLTSYHKQLQKLY